MMTPDARRTKCLDIERNSFEQSTPKLKLLNGIPITPGSALKGIMELKRTPPDIGLGAMLKRRNENIDSSEEDTGELCYVNLKTPFKNNKKTNFEPVDFSTVIDGKIPSGRTLARSPVRLSDFGSPETLDDQEFEIRDVIMEPGSRIPRTPMHYSGRPSAASDLVIHYSKNSLRNSGSNSLKKEEKTKSPTKSKKGRKRSFSSNSVPVPVVDEHEFVTENGGFKPKPKICRTPLKKSLALPNEDSILEVCEMTNNNSSVNENVSTEESVNLLEHVQTHSKHKIDSDIAHDSRDTNLQSGHIDVTLAIGDSKHNEDMSDKANQDLLINKLHKITLSPSETNANNSNNCARTNKKANKIELGLESGEYIDNHNSQTIPSLTKSLNDDSTKTKPMTSNPPTSNSSDCHSTENTQNSSHGTFAQSDNKSWRPLLSPAIKIRKPLENMIPKGKSLMRTPPSCKFARPEGEGNSVSPTLSTVQEDLPEDPDAIFISLLRNNDPLPKKIKKKTYLKTNKSKITNSELKIANPVSKSKTNTTNRALESNISNKLVKPKHAMTKPHLLDSKTTCASIQDKMPSKKIISQSLFGLKQKDIEHVGNATEENQKVFPINQTDSFPEKVSDKLPSKNLRKITYVVETKCTKLISQSLFGLKQKGNEHVGNATEENQKVFPINQTDSFAEKVSDKLPSKNLRKMAYVVETKQTETEKSLEEADNSLLCLDELCDKSLNLCDSLFDEVLNKNALSVKAKSLVSPGFDSIISPPSPTEQTAIPVKNILLGDTPSQQCERKSKSFNETFDMESSSGSDEFVDAAEELPEDQEMHSLTSPLHNRTFEVSTPLKDEKTFEIEPKHNSTFDVIDPNSPFDKAMSPVKPAEDRDGNETFDNDKPINSTFDVDNNHEVLNSTYDMSKEQHKPNSEVGSPTGTLENTASTVIENLTPNNTFETASSSYNMENKVECHEIEMLLQKETSPRKDTDSDNPNSSTQSFESSLSQNNKELQITDDPKTDDNLIAKSPKESITKRRKYKTKTKYGEDKPSENSNSNTDIKTEEVFNADAVGVSKPVPPKKRTYKKRGMANDVVSSNETLTSSTKHTEESSSKVMETAIVEKKETGVRKTRARNIHVTQNETKGDVSREMEVEDLINKEELTSGKNNGSVPEESSKLGLNTKVQEEPLGDRYLECKVDNDKPVKEIKPKRGKKAKGQTKDRDEVFEMEKQEQKNLEIVAMDTHSKEKEDSFEQNKPQKKRGRKAKIHNKEQGSSQDEIVLENRNASAAVNNELNKSSEIANEPDKRCLPKRNQKINYAESPIIESLPKTQSGACEIQEIEKINKSFDKTSEEKVEVIPKRKPAPRSKILSLRASFGFVKKDASVANTTDCTPPENLKNNTTAKSQNSTVSDITEKLGNISFEVSKLEESKPGKKLRQVRKVVSKDAGDQNQMATRHRLPRTKKFVGSYDEDTGTKNSNNNKSMKPAEDATSIKYKDISGQIVKDDQITEENSQQEFYGNEKNPDMSNKVITEGDNIFESGVSRKGMDGPYCSTALEDDSKESKTQSSQERIKNLQTEIMSGDMTTVDIENHSRKSELASASETINVNDSLKNISDGNTSKDVCDTSNDIANLSKIDSSHQIEMGCQADTDQKQSNNSKEIVKATEKSRRKSGIPMGFGTRPVAKYVTKDHSTNQQQVKDSNISKILVSETNYETVNSSKLGNKRMSFGIPVPSAQTVKRRSSLIPPRSSYSANLSSVKPNIVRSTSRPSLEISSNPTVRGVKQGKISGKPILSSVGSSSGFGIKLGCVSLSKKATETVKEVVHPKCPEVSEIVTVKPKRTYTRKTKVSVSKKPENTQTAESVEVETRTRKTRGTKKIVSPVEKPPVLKNQDQTDDKSNRLRKIPSRKAIRNPSLSSIPSPTVQITFEVSPDAKNIELPKPRKRQKRGEKIKDKDLTKVIPNTNTSAANCLSSSGIVDNLKGSQHEPMDMAHEVTDEAGINNVNPNVVEQAADISNIMQYRTSETFVADEPTKHNEVHKSKRMSLIPSFRKSVSSSVSNEVHQRKAKDLKETVEKIENLQITSPVKTKTTRKARQKTKGKDDSSSSNTTPDKDDLIAKKRGRKKKVLEEVDTNQVPDKKNGSTSEEPTTNNGNKLDSKTVSKTSKISRKFSSACDNLESSTKLKTGTTRSLRSRLK